VARSPPRSTLRRITASLGTESNATHTREVRVKDGKRTYPRVKKSVDVPWEEWIGVHLDKLEPEERNRVYKMLDLKVLGHRDGNLEVKWALGGDPCGDNEPLPPGNYRTGDR
jgi:hypothetical protein